MAYSICVAVADSERMRAGLAGMVTEPLAGVTLTGNVAAAGACVPDVDCAAVVDLADDPHAVTAASISSDAAPMVARLRVVRAVEPAAVDRMVTERATVCNFTLCNFTLCNFTLCNFTLCNFTVSSCRSRAAARRQWHCRSTCAFLACVVATGGPGDLARPPRRNDSCGNSAGFSPDFADLPVASGKAKPPAARPQHRGAPQTRPRPV